MLIETSFDCAYCGEPNETTVDLTGGETQEYVEDCRVCCQPNNLYVTGRISSGEAWIESFTDDE
ncbi:MAG: CPXCG motif-containing cysteine-rich protein [Candidatus Eisenbacteria bacterium]|nr:CPXCG motif-containing cysteine-rich protein [Candidatus Eisenbacteria bacterium]